MLWLTWQEVLSVGQAANTLIHWANAQQDGRGLWTLDGGSTSVENEEKKKDDGWWNDKWWGSLRRKRGLWSRGPQPDYAFNRSLFLNDGTIDANLALIYLRNFAQASSDAWPDFAFRETLLILIIEQQLWICSLRWCLAAQWPRLKVCAWTMWGWRRRCTKQTARLVRNV